MNNKILVIGSSNTDMTIKGKKLPAPGETVTGGVFYMGPGGKGANQAVAAKRLGGDVEFICKVGNDIFGDNALEGYRKEGIDISHVMRSKEASGTALILVDDSGENCISVASGANGDLTPADIEGILRSNPDNVVIVDEAYIDFGGVSCVPLIEKYDNLLVTQTFSKSRSLAGGRLGFGIGCESLIRDLNTVKYSVNPYNVNRMTQAAGAVAIDDNDYYMENARTIGENREYTAKALQALGFRVLPSRANFLFAESPDIPGGELYAELKRRGVLVRHFPKDRIDNFTRITVGTREQMDTLLAQVRAILEERGIRL